MTNKKFTPEAVYEVEKPLSAQIVERINVFETDERERCLSAYRDVLEIIYNNGVNTNLSLYIFDGLVQRLLENKIDYSNLQLVFWLLATIKVHVWILPLMSFPVKMRLHFFDNMYLLERFVKEISEHLKPHLKDAYEEGAKDFVSEWVYLRTLLLAYSAELPAIYAMWSEQRILHTICSRCKEDLRTVIFNGDNAEAKVADRIFEDNGQPQTDAEASDVFGYTWEYAKEFPDIAVLTMLSRLYGTRQCIHCGNQEPVIDTYMNWWKQERGMQKPSLELIDWLLEVAGEEMNSGKEHAGQRALFYYRQALYYMCERNLQPRQKAADCLLKISSMYQLMFYSDLPAIYAKKAVELLEAPLTQEGAAEDGGDVSGREYQLLLAEAYRSLAIGYSSNYGHEEKNRPDLAVQYYNKAKDILDQYLGEGNEKSESIEKNIAMLANQGDEETTDGINKLQEQIAHEEKKDSPDKKKMAENYNLLADLYANQLGDYEKTYECYEKYIAYNKEEYGENSDMVADCYEFMGDYHEEAGDLEGACKYYEMALDINIREMGKMYLLPPIFKGVAVGVMAAAGKIDKEDKFNRSMSASDSYLNVGEMYVQLGRPKEAIKALQKCIALRDWEFDGQPTGETAFANMLMGDAYLLMGRRGDAKEAYENALGRYRGTIANNELRNSPLFDSETEECKEQEQVLLDKLKALD